MQTTTPSWLDIMPALPLARSVPVVKLNGSRRVELGGIVSLAASDGMSASILSGDMGQGYLHLQVDEGLRVDLDDLQGFAYGLRLLYDADEHPAQAILDDLLNSWLCGEVTDRDRLALARALAAVAL